ncbi:MAG: hypothetical protein K2P80_08490 [Beijerinckiaceae bacterium]|nr:hypothetical protein [Beijerinckiaceae bacterium]
MPALSRDRPPNAAAKSDDGIVHYLENDAYEVAIDPSRGGLIRRLVWKRGGPPVDLLYSPESQPQSDAGIDLFGCWPLVPFANRCHGGMLVFGETRWTLPINDPASGNTMHGTGWRRAWTVDEISRQSLTLSHCCDAGFGAYRYESSLRLSLRDDVIRIDLSVTNRGDEPAPFGLGLHPWFPCDETTTLRVDGVAAKVAFAPGYHPLDAIPLDPAGDFLIGGAVARETEIAINYVGWRGAATLTYPGSHILRITASPSLDMPLLWRPPGARFVCFEPQSHVIGAPSDRKGWQISPMWLLECGQSMAGWMELTAASPEPASRVAAISL